MTTKRGGEVDLGSGKKQHVDYWRKVKLRRELLGKVGPGAAYVPFLGEGDIAAELYGGRRIVGIELDPDIADTARARLRTVALGGDPLVIAGDAEIWHPEAVTVDAFSILDVDAYSNPYVALDVAWRALVERDPLDKPGLADVVAVFGTDGMRLAIRRSKTRALAPLPKGKPLRTVPINVRRIQWNGWWTKTVRPYLEGLVAPGRIVADAKYLRDHMLYWGIVVDRRDVTASASPGEATPADRTADVAPNADDLAAVEAALLEAAKSGNVPAAIFWLEHKGGSTWTKTSPASAALDELVGRKRSTT